MITPKISGEMRDMVLRIYWKESEKWAKENNKPFATIFSHHALFSANTTNETILNYHRLAIVELRKQKLNKIWKKIQV